MAVGWMDASWSFASDDVRSAKADAGCRRRGGERRSRGGWMGQRGSCIDERRRDGGLEGIVVCGGVRVCLYANQRKSKGRASLVAGQKRAFLSRCVLCQDPSLYEHFWMDQSTSFAHFSAAISSVLLNIF